MRKKKKLTTLLLGECFHRALTGQSCFGSVRYVKLYYAPQFLVVTTDVSRGGIEVRSMIHAIGCVI